MPGYKQNRIASDLRLVLADLLRELKDPRISGLLSIVKLNVSGDLSVATVYVSAIEGHDATVESVQGLKNATGYLRRELGTRLKLRKVPELRFVPDDSIAQSANISAILHTLAESEAKIEPEKETRS